MLKNIVRALAYGKDFLHELHAFTYGTYIRIRTEVIAATASWSTMKIKARIFFVREQQIRITFIVPKQDIVVGAIFLYQLVFKDEGLGLRKGYGKLDVMNMPYQGRRLGTYLF